MTFGEVARKVESYNKMHKIQAQEQAIRDYKLADLIGHSMARLHSSNAKMPTIDKVYPELFSSEEIEEKMAARQDELSALRFKQFVAFHNMKSKEAANKNE